MAATAGIGESAVTLQYSPVAYEEIEDYRIVCFSNVDERIIKATAATINPIGVSQQASDLHSEDTYAAGRTVNVAIGGVAYVKMEGSGLRGNSVIAGTDGKGKKFTLNSADQWIIGQAFRNWNDGDIIPVHLDKTFIGNVDAAS